MVYVKTKPQSGILHEYSPGLTAFQFGGGQPKNVLVFIGGLGDGLLTVPYVANLAANIQESTNGEWTVVQALISASYQGWGTSTLSRDVKELGQLVSYLKSSDGGSFNKAVLMGHSTGCQDTLYYISKANPGDVPSLDGAILQAPVSDSEGFALGFKNKAEFDKSIEIVRKEYIETGKGQHILPEKFRREFWNTPITAYRYYSLASERGDDDFFSSYLTSKDHELTFGKVSIPLLVLYGSKDEFVPESVDKSKVINGWKDATNPKYWSPLSKILQGASHNVGPKSDSGAEEDLLSTVSEFIKQF
ncbi:hypothetical protein CAAN1_11S01486 [[Candida] anglica]|uniref:DUF1749-domain-containing protein n=1 Tax=[Candida] anglica TaxID=148631 RepID=A0ABP0EKB6_9ASCO